MEVAFDVYASLLPVDRSSLRDQMFVYWLILTTGGAVMYLLCASLSTYLLFFKLADTYFPRTMRRAEVCGQMVHEIFIAVASVPFMAVLMTPAAVLSHRGYSRLYYNVGDYGWPYLCLSAVFFFLFTDFMVYWFHRGLHHPTLYRYLHKLHHTYRYTTPFSSHAFNPCDGFGQGVPYYAFIFLFPVHHYLFVLLFIAVNLWTVSIHDQVDFGGHVINTTGHHTIHHEKFNYDYGQYFTFWDRIGGTYKAARQTHFRPVFSKGGRVPATQPE